MQVDNTVDTSMQVDNTVEMEVDNTVEVSASTSTSPFMCHLCSKTFGQRRSLSRHFESHSNKSHECAECDHKFTSRYNLARHIVMVHKPKDNIYCPHCGKEFKSACALAHHVSFHHRGGGKECQLCKKRFKDTYSLKRHMQSHETETSTCAKCSKSVKDLTRHDKNCHSGKKNSRRYLCEPCNKMYSCKKHLSVHMKTKHQGECHFPCGCGKVFSYRSTLNRHKKSCPNADM